MAFFENLENGMIRREHEKFMRAAIKEAQKAWRIDEVPIGCVIVQNGHIIARGYNRRNTDKNVTKHAELSAIESACRKTGDWRLEDCELYVTLEPCPMCAGAIVQARIPKVYVGAMNPKAGCAGSILDLFSEPRFNHQVECETGILEAECAQLLTGFFEELRLQKRAKQIGEALKGKPDAALNGKPEAALPSPPPLAALPGEAPDDLT